MSPFTLVLCRAEGCTGPAADATGPVERVLGETTRRSSHGVLVLSGCLMGSLCRICGPAAAGAAAHPGGPATPVADAATEGAMATRAPSAEGRVALVQPCHPDRAPSGPAVLVGPIRGSSDTAALSHWLRDGALTADRLPERLRGYERVLRRGPLN